MSINEKGDEREPEETAPAREEEVESNGHPETTNETPEVEEELTEVERLERELETMEDKFLRKTAELENFRRRMRAVRQQTDEEARADVIARFLDVVDDFDRSLQAAEQAEADGEAGPAFETLKEGVKLVYNKFLDELNRLGVERIEAEGQPFDEQEHDAMMQQPAPEDMEPGTVLQVVQPGYRLGERIIRHAKVVVAQ